MSSAKKNLTFRLFLFLILGGVLAVYQVRGDDVPQGVVDTRATLHKQGFKTDLSEFNFHTDSAARSRELALTFLENQPRPVTAPDGIDLMPLVDEYSAIGVWRQDWLKNENDEGPVTWADLKDALEANDVPLDAACDAALSGPVRFDLEASGGSAMLLRHLAPLKRLSQTLAVRALLDLHEGRPDAAFTNILAQSRLVTAWQPEPAEVSHQVRFGMVDASFKIIWQMLQTNQWPDEQLAQLQQEWTAADFFNTLPDIMAFTRASRVADCQRERSLPVGGGPSASELAKEAVHDPGAAAGEVERSLQRAKYKSYGTYEDEQALLLFYRDREVEWRAAVRATNWLTMQPMPGVTNSIIFRSKFPSRLQYMMNSREISKVFMNHGISFLGHAALAETERRIIVTAIALKRCQQKNGMNPISLAALTPEFLPAVPVDFMDGRPLRYQLMADGNFVLYSVGLDGVDDGGKLALNSNSDRWTPAGSGAYSTPSPTVRADIAWPLAASSVKVAKVQEQEANALLLVLDQQEDQQATYQWERTARHQGAVTEPYTTNEFPVSADPGYGLHPLAEILLNPDTDKQDVFLLGRGAQAGLLAKILTLKPVVTGEEPETITYEAPIAYDVLANLSGSLALMLDTNCDDYDGGCDAEQTDFSRATNGDCLLAWHTIYESPGAHALQLSLEFEHPVAGQNFFYGPVARFVVTNLCQFSDGSSTYTPETGALFHAQLPEADCKYAIDCLTTNGALLKTLSGTTTNGEIRVRWNLVADDGHRLTGETFNSVIHLTFPDSGRTQTLRGP